jgi:hypothetical protein
MPSSRNDAASENLSLGEHERERTARAAEATISSSALGTDAAQGRLSVIDIVAKGRSGSTLVGLLLGQLPGFVDVGELRYVWTRRLGKGANVLCGCGTVLSECPFWEQVGQDAFGGWDALDATHVLELERAVERERFIPLLLQPKALRVYGAKLHEYTDLLARLLQGIARVAGARVVVDGSKLLSRALVLHHVEGVDLSFLHIVRDCRGVAFSWSKRVARPETLERVSYMPRIGPAAVSTRWVYHNVGAHMLALLRHPHAFMRYETFVQDPQSELSRVLRVLGQGEAVPNLGFIGEKMSLRPTHSVWGNPMRLETRAVAIRLDDQWRREMRPRDRRVVTLLAWPLLRAYGYTRGESL